MKKITYGILMACSVITSPIYALGVDVINPNQDAQEHLRQLERLNQLRQQQEIKPDVREAGALLQQLLQQSVPTANEVIPENETPCFTISTIHLIGDSASHFQFALDELIGKVPTALGFEPSESEVNKIAKVRQSILGHCFGMNGINALMARLQNTIIAQGYITTRVLAAPQDLKSGQLELTVVPGRVHAIRFTPDSNKRARIWNAVPIEVGDILNLRDIEQALENFKRVPTVEADIQIEPASTVSVTDKARVSTSDQLSSTAQPGLSDLVISYQQRPLPFRVSVSLDDSGSPATGKYQGSITLSGDNLLTLNDLFYASFNHDVGGNDTGIHGTSGYAWHYSLPYGYWLLSTTTSNNDYHQTVPGATQNYIYSGRSENSDLTLSRLLFRNTINKSSLSARAFYRTSYNFIDDTDVDVQRRRVAGWELGFNQTWYLGNAVLDYHVNYRRGTGAWNALPAPEEHFGDGTARMHMLMEDLSLTIPFSMNVPWGVQALQYNANLRGQTNSTPLTPQDRFSIGNRYTVRGFDGTQTLLADNGWFIQNTLTAPISSTGQSFYMGIDYGAVGGQSSAMLIGKELAGAVLGLRGDVNSGIGRFSYDLFVGQPIYKPKGYVTSSTTAGFNLNWSY